MKPAHALLWLAISFVVAVAAPTAAQVDPPDMLSDAPTDSADVDVAPPAEVGDPPPPVGDAPPLPPADAHHGVEDYVERDDDIGALDVTLAAVIGTLGGGAGALVALATVSLFLGMASSGAAAISVAGPAGLLGGFGLMLVGGTFALVMLIFSPAIAAIVAGTAILLGAVDATDEDWRQLGALTMAVGCATLMCACAIVGAFAGGDLGGASIHLPGPWDAPPQGEPQPWGRPALSSTMTGTALGAAAGPWVTALVASGVTFPLIPALVGIGVESDTAAALPLTAFVLGLPVGLVLGAAVGGGVGGALGMRLEEDVAFVAPAP